MPLNIPGTLVPLHLLINPRLIVPQMIVKDIRQLDFPELRRTGYRGAVFDKDNCLTPPHRDTLVPDLKDAWDECRKTFGPQNVLIVSNSAGSHLDAGEIQAESVSHHLSAPVLRHPSFKPSYSCISSIRAYFASLPRPVRDEELIVVGDRIFTDTVMANRMARHERVSQPTAPSPAGEQPDLVDSPSKELDVFAPRAPASSPTASSRVRVGPLAILTTTVWERDSPILRRLEMQLLRGVERWVLGEGRGAAQDWTDVRYGRFFKELAMPEVLRREKPGFVRRMLRRWRGE
ncbi:mitochondrial PGP phosphatase-domain-containing protein [Fomitopsis serialis]|uniref:mitochondrial PGP phosphatase-domain-containing protein n=1 Tax=Fomitopsis serialis TaxID=139415 RepID=UPI002007B256|nr:mitochondrial PGP phosphatase-domain-containing protein [Neoantrodia serialis]KAH9915908.1 mitochondrial PGP phosphatase-domain-containing protein [Neoantrodia serialis]